MGSSVAKSAALLASQANCSTAQSVAGQRDFNAEASNVERTYRLADALRDAEKALDALPTAERGGRPDLDALLDKPLYPSDLNHLAKQVRNIADQWQSEIDALEGALS